MTFDTHPLERVLRDAAERSEEIRAETRQAALNLERLIQLVVGSEEIPDEFRPRLLSELPPDQWRPSAQPPAPDVEEEPVFSAGQPIEVDGRTAATPPEAAPMDPQNLRPEDGGIALAYAPGDMLFSKGDPAEVFFVITEGHVSLFEPTTGFEMATLTTGASLGEQSILMGGVHSLSARAVDRVVCTTVRADRLRSILDQQPGLVKPLFEAVLLQLSMHNELRGQGNPLTL